MSMYAPSEMQMFSVGLDYNQNNYISSKLPMISKFSLAKVEKFNKQGILYISFSLKLKYIFTLK